VPIVSIPVENWLIRSFGAAFLRNGTGVDYFWFLLLSWYSTIWLTVNQKVEYNRSVTEATLTRRHGGHGKNLDLIFGAVADATRRSMLDRLRGGALTVSELARPYPMSLNAVSKHVKTLEKAGLIRRTISGREHSCQLAAARSEDAMKWMSYYSEFWGDRIGALEKHLVEKR